MTKHEWMVSVLMDLRDYCEANELNQTMKQTALALNALRFEIHEDSGNPVLGSQDAR